MILLLATLSYASPPGAVWVGGGSYIPLYPADKDHPEVQVGGFWLDIEPVTLGNYQRFVLAQPQWQRGQVPALFADPSYLGGWLSPVEPGGNLRRPVVQVSWHAARAYCQAQGRRLPTEDEWEIAASADEHKAFARDDPAWTAKILAWYASPNTDLEVGTRPANYWGVRDLHGLVWEWVEDYNNTVYGTDNRASGDEDLLRFCGAGALSATDATDYANFMRVAFRTSLEAKYTTKNLGFRCASDEAPP